MKTKEILRPFSKGHSSGGGWEGRGKNGMGHRFHQETDVFYLFFQYQNCHVIVVFLNTQFVYFFKECMTPQQHREEKIFYDF